MADQLPSFLFSASELHLFISPIFDLQSSISTDSPSQPFWGNMVARAGAGPRPIPFASLNFQNLTAAIKFCLTPEATEAARKLAVKMQTESGVAAAVDSFHRKLPLDKMKCNLMPLQVAVWTYKKGKGNVILSNAAVQILIEHQKIDEKRLQLYVPRLELVYEPTNRWLHYPSVISLIQSLLNIAAGIP